MKMRNYLMIAVSGILLTGTALTNAQANDVWKGNAELGLLLTDGNTETRTTNAKFKIQNERDKWRHTLSLEALNSGDSETTTSERYTGKGQTAYKFSKFNYAFAEGNGEHDRFSGYDYRASIVIGYGRRLMDKDDMRLDVELGPGYRESKPDATKSEGEGVFQIGGKYDWDISKTTLFTQELNSQIGEDATISKSITSLSAQIVGNMAMKTSLTIRNTSKVPDGIEKTDSELGVTLVYSF